MSQSLNGNKSTQVFREKIWVDKTEKGTSIIEILVVIAIIGIALVSLLGLATFSLKASTLIKETSQAKGLAVEAMEALRSFRDGTTWGTDGIGALNTGINYYPVKSTDTPPRWQLNLGEENINGFTRKVVFDNVSRDAADNIETTYNPANDDPETRKVTVTVSWEDKKVEIVTYLTNWQ